MGLSTRVSGKNTVVWPTAKTETKKRVRKGPCPEVFREHNQVPRKRKESRKMLRLWHWGSVGTHKWFSRSPA